ncbi:MAG: DinB family protein [Anaerolineae bacterium]|jgi:hypothetical protein
MTHPDAEWITQSYRTTQWVIHRQTEGLEHHDSLLQLPFRGNCLNWVLGHTLVGRDQALILLGREPVLSKEEADRYRTGSMPIVDDSQALRLEDLLAGIDQAQARIESALTEVSADVLATPVDFRGRQTPLGQAVAGLHWHETYHTGQLEILRQLAGKDDAVI